MCVRGGWDFAVKRAGSALDSERVVAPVCEDKTSQQKHKQYIHLCFVILLNIISPWWRSPIHSLHYIVHIFIFIAILYIE